MPQTAQDALPVGRRGQGRETDQADERLDQSLSHHDKDIFEAADTGVLEFRGLMFPCWLYPREAGRLAKS